MEKESLNNILKTSVYSSLFVQFITGIIDIYFFLIPVAGEVAIVKKMLGLELFVQLIEGAFYVWFASIFSFVKNVTPNRYYDWAITTPTMLFTFCLYLDYLGEREKTKKNREPFAEPENNSTCNKKPSVKNITLSEYFKKNWGILLPIFFLNWMMLIFGYLGESGDLDTKTSVLCGFLPFITYFVIIYEKFAKYSSFYGKILYWCFFAIWALYGVAALGSYYWKNIAYNILDLFAKNFFGIVLAYTLYIHVA
jgi:hypothetical protein